MKVKVKICGVKTPNMAQYAIGQGAAFIGVVFFEKSPRHISFGCAAAIHKAISGNAPLVAVMVNPDDSYIAEMLENFIPEYIQLHGGESPERALEIKDKFGVKVIKAISVSERSDIKRAVEYRGIVDYIIFDSKPPKNSNLPGGNAVSFDWDILSNIDIDMKYMLSGGLNIDNVSSAIEQTKVRYIDLSSGVESSSGVKSKELIRSLFEKVKKR